MAETVLARYLGILVETMAEEYGTAPDALFRAASLARLDLNHEGRLTMDVAETLWVAADGIADDQLGIKVGARVRYSTYSTLGHLLVTSRTVGDALKAACEFAFYVGAAGHLKMTTEAGVCRIRYEPSRADMKIAEARSEAVLLPFVRFARWASPGVVPAKVMLAREKPSTAAAFMQAFAAPIEFGATGYGIEWPIDMLERPMSDANPALNDMLRQHVASEMPEGSDMATRVRHLLGQQLEGGSELETGMPQIKDVARLLGVSERSLQRQLAAENTSFRDLLATVRNLEAQKMLKQSVLSVAEIARKLGYSEPAAFVRAFKLWHGTAPAQWRKSRSS